MKRHIEARIIYAHTRRYSHPHEHKQVRHTHRNGPRQSLLHWRLYSDPGLLVPSSSALTTHPQPAPPLRKYSSRVPRASQEMLCTLWVSQAIFCPRTGGRLGWEQPVMTHSAVFCLFFHDFLPLQLAVSVILSLSVFVLSLYFSFNCQAYFDPMPLTPFTQWPTYPQELSSPSASSSDSFL